MSSPPYKKYQRKTCGPRFWHLHPEQVREGGRVADGVIVGSAIVKMIEENLNNPELVAKVGDFVSSLVGELKSGNGSYG